MTTVNEEQILNYKCKHCGVAVYNATKTQVNCTNCGKRTTVINPITKEKKK